MSTQLEITGFFMMEQKTFFQHLGQRLVWLRKEHGLTQGQLAERAECSQQMIAEYEKGKRNIPLWRLVNIADALGVGVDDLLRDSGNGSGKRGPPSKVDRLAEEISRLPRSRRRFVVEMIENALGSR